MSYSDIISAFTEKTIKVFSVMKAKSVTLQGGKPPLKPPKKNRANLR